MRLRRLVIRRLPGIDRGLALEDLVDGLNLIVGPNGSGKTALCRTFGAVVWPELESGRGFSGEAAWQEDEQRVTVRRDGQRVVWQREGSACEPPLFPEIHTARCFTLDFRDLTVEGSSTDETVAVEVRTQTSGGYDLDRVIADCLELRPRHGLNEDNRLRERSRDLEHVRRAQRELGDRELERLQLERELDEARASAARLEPLRAAIELCRVREQRLSIEQRLEQLPAGIELVRGDEDTQLVELEQQRAELVRTLAESTERIERLERERERMAPPAGIPAEPELKSWIHRARTLHQQEGERRQAQRACSEADTASRAAAAGLDPERVAGSTPSIDESAVSRMETFVEMAARLRARREQLNDEREALGETTAAPHSEDELDSAAEQLRTWLAASAIRGVAWGRWVAGLALLSLAAAVGSWVSGADLVWSVAAGTAGGVLLLVAILSGLVHPSARRMQAARTGFEELDPSPPESWDDEAVRRRLRELQQLRSEAAFAQRQRRHREELTSRLEALAHQQTALEEERGELRRRFGVDPGSGQLEPLRFIQRVQRYQVAEERYREGRAKLERVGRQHAESLEALNGFVVGAGSNSVTDAASALAALDDLRDRGRRIQHIGEQLQQASGRLAEIEQRRSGLARKRDQLFVLAGLEPGDDDGLALRLRSRPDYVSLVEALRARSATVEDLTRRSDGWAEAEDHDEKRLARLVLLAEAAADRVVELAEEVGQIKEAVRVARAGQLMEDALAGVDEARESLRACRDEALSKTAGRFLIDRVADEFDRGSRPEILSRAIDLFGRFTHQRFELKIDLAQTPPSFRAVELETGHGKALSELSSATRLQLLLAARLAYVLHVDPQGRLPLLLDEVLATSDPERFVAIAESLLMLAGEERRQILYFTSDPADVRRWQSVLRNRGLAMPQVVDLGTEQGRSGSELGIEEPELPPIPEIPAPGEDDAPRYAAKLGVPRADPERSVNSLHLFHLLRDELDVVHQLLTARIRTVGQWRRFSQTGDGVLLIGAVPANRLSARADLAEAFFDCRRIGRGRPVDTTELAAAELSEAWIARLESLVDEQRGDARALLEALTVRVDERTKGFHTRVRQRLREHLIAGGYLDERETLAEHEIHARVRVAVAVHVESGLLSANEVVALVHQLLYGTEPSVSMVRDRLARDEIRDDGASMRRGSQEKDL